MQRSFWEVEKLFRFFSTKLVEVRGLKVDSMIYNFLSPFANTRLSQFLLSWKRGARKCRSCLILATGFIHIFCN